MAVELSLSVGDPDLDQPPGGAEAVKRWATAATAADEACLVLDLRGVVVAASAGYGAMFSIDIAEAIGRPLLEGGLTLLDFNTVSGALPGWEIDKIPPLLALSTKSLARGLLRVRGDDGEPTTVDAISAPLREGEEVVGSLTFFALVRR